MKRFGPDSTRSWVIAFACCFINMMMYAMARLGGVLFVASMTAFNVSREKASFPYTFDNFMRNFTGPLVGFLGHKFGVRAVTTIGCIVGAVGIGTCYFAQNIDTVLILWGGVWGLGFGLGNVLLPVSINQHFDKHRATASGISFSGACLGSIMLPPIVEILLNNYGLNGTYLFLSGFILNCVPAALLLRKPNYVIENTKSDKNEESERQRIVSGPKVKMYTVEDNCSRTDNISGAKNFGSVSESEIENSPRILTYEERIKRLSTQTLLSDYSIRMSVSEPLDVDQIIKNSKGRRKVNPEVLDAEVVSLSSHEADQDLFFEEDDAFEKDVRSSSVQYEKPISADNINRNRAFSAESMVPDKEKCIIKKYRPGYQNYGYKTDSEYLKSNNGLSVSSSCIAQRDVQRFDDAECSDNNAIYFNCSYQRNENNLKIPPEQYKNQSNNPNIFSKSSEWSDIDNFKVRHGMLSCSTEKNISQTENTSSLGSFKIIFDPMFILIAITNAIYCFIFVCIITVIVDFARDLNVGASNEKYIIMTLSVGDLIGRVGLGWITDGGYMTTTSFAALCFACQGLATAAIAWSDGFTMLMIIATLYGLSEAGLIMIFPVIIAQYIDSDKQTVAIPSSNFLSGPLCLIVAPLIGYFRDYLGAYDYLFYGLSILSALCSFAWILAPCVARCRNQQ